MTTTIQSPVSIAAQYGVTQEQIDACQRWEHENTHTVFYTVESASQPGTYYRVAWNKEYGCLQCMPHNGEPCKASESGLPCWHKRAARAAEKLYKAERQRERQREQAAVEATPEYQLEQGLYEIERGLQELEEIFRAIDEIVQEADQRERERKDAEYTRYLNYCIQLDI